MGRHGLDSSSEDRDRWLALMSAIMNIWVIYNAGDFLTNRGPVDFLRRVLLPTAS
jgi:hypothetical protein